MNEKQLDALATLNQIEEWICIVEWVQVTPSDGAWSWRMYRIENNHIHGIALAEGVAFWKIGVYYRVWRACRKYGLRFRPNVRGTIPKDEDE